MDHPIDDHHPETFWRRRWKALLIGVMGLIGLCIVAVCMFPSLVVGLPAAVTPTHRQIAQQALQNPSGATLHLGHYGDISAWPASSATDYAVQDGMVIFPRPETRFLAPKYGPITDISERVLVYAPDGSDLAARPDPPAERDWFYGNEWFLYKCSPVANQPLWWACTLLIGFNI